MTNLSSNEKLNMLVESLNLLAADYNVQTIVLPDFVHIPDEIALIFSDCNLSAEELLNKGIISKLQRDMLFEIDKILDEMSNNKGLWTLESLKQSNEWEEIRKIAKDTLTQLGNEKKKPDLYWIKYQK